MKSSILIVLWLMVFPLCETAFSQHGHINAGAMTSESGSQLYFVNGNNFVTNSGFVLNLVESKAGPYQGSYEGSISFTALPATVNTGGPAFGHASLGSFLELEVHSVIGPKDGIFSVWMEDEDLGSTTQLLSAPVGTRNGTNRFNLSEGTGDPDDDPYGHIHGRKFVADKPGLYAVGFRIVETSPGGPRHQPSDIFNMYFQAGITISLFSKSNNVATVTFGTRKNWRYSLEQTTNPGAANSWKRVDGPVTGNDNLQTLTDPAATTQARFYRLFVEP